MSIKSYKVDKLVIRRLFLEDRAQGKLRLLSAAA